MRSRVAACRALGLGGLVILVAAALVDCAKKPNPAGPAGPAPLQSGAPLSACEQERSPFARDSCYAKEAKNTAAPGLCLHLAQEHRQAECVAATGDGIAACQQANAIAPLPECFRNIAYHTQDATACNLIKPLAERSSCISTVASMSDKPSSCATIPQPRMQDECWKSFARRRKDPKLCDSIKNAFRRDNCRLDTATLEEGPPDGCARIENPALRDECWIQVVAKDGAPEDLCEQVSSRKNRCYLALARRKGPTFCERVGGGPESTARRLCYQEVFRNVRPRDANELCVSVTDALLKQECTRARAESLQDVSLCAAIALPEIADDCFEALASKTADACLRIKDPGHLRKCARNNWSRSHDPRMCAPLSPHMRRDCSEQMAKRR